MEDDSAAVEYLILFYINMKQVLKTKQLIERVFLDQMRIFCKENGFKKYNDEEIRNTWKNLVSKYLNLKAKGTSEEKASWKYFNILDSCYEKSDFQNGVYPKFSEEMVWLLIECFLKRKALGKTQKHGSIVTQIHNEFLEFGYLYITKQDIENKWRYLNVKYEKAKGKPEDFQKIPYLQALAGFREPNKNHAVKMVFTRNLTDILIERFTEKKITCVIHGYDSDQVLNEIQSEFRDLGFDFSKEDIIAEWRKLTTVYKFLISQGVNVTSWIYFSAMKNHFKDDPVFPGDKMTKSTRREKEQSIPRRLRQRSKSVGAELSRMNKTNLFELDKCPPTEGNACINKNKPVKRPIADRRKSNSRKKSKNKTVEDEDLKKDFKISKMMGNFKNKSEDELSDIPETKDGKQCKKEPQLNKLYTDQNQEMQSSASVTTPTSKVHIININQSQIDEKNGNLTINLPSITKQFSDNEFLPLKKRLRVAGDNSDKKVDVSKNVKDEFLGFPKTEISEAEKHFTHISDEKRVTEEEMADIMERINQEKSQNNESINYNSGNYHRLDDIPNFPGQYSQFGQPCLIVPKEEHQDNQSMQNYITPTNMAQPPVLLLVIKVDGSGNNAPKDGNSCTKDNTSNKINLKDIIDSSDRKEEKEKIYENLSSNLEGRQLNITTQKSTAIVKPVSPKGKTIIINKKNASPLNANYIDVNQLHNKNEKISARASNSNYNSSLQISDCQSSIVVAKSEPDTVKSTSLNKSNSDVHFENNYLNDICPVGEHVTVYTTEDVHSENKRVPQKAEEVVFRQPLPVEVPDKVNSCSLQKAEEVVFQQPLPVSRRAKVNTLSTASGTVTENKIPVPDIKQKGGAGRVSLPVTTSGKLKEIFISPRELSKIAKLRSGNIKGRGGISRNPLHMNTRRSAVVTNVATQGPYSYKILSQAVKPLTGDSSDTTMENSFKTDDQSIDDSSGSTAQPKTDPKCVEGSSFSGNRNGKNEEFENESVLSEAIGDDDGLKDNLLATVIDFQEQNNQEFIEIKNLMKQNNLLQRETNRLLRAMLETM